MGDPVYPGNDIKGWMSQKELQWLYEQARNMDSIVEIGCWHGRSTHAFLSGCRGTVYAVDHWQGSPGANGEILFACRDVKAMDVFAAFMKNVGGF
ncbi:MAG: class I SAM-dependent methyltransferase, partial [Proteobacteria bacterium]|nr:class I SAM-dependent methyltransferase [Pseudomonadota bacterium]